jgi:Family of unknown function (DUF6459)
MTAPAPRSTPRSLPRDAPFPPHSPGVQGTLALDLLAAQPGPPDTPELDATRRPRVPHVADHEVRGWAARFAQAVVEVVGGQRPASQLVRWAAPDVHRDLARRAHLVGLAAGRAGRSVHPQVRSVHICRPSPTSAEVSVHVRHGARSRALAMRLVRQGDRWTCTALEFG